MNEDDQKNRFADRIARIDKNKAVATNGNPAAQQAVARRPSSRISPTIRVALIAVLTLTIMSAAMVLGTKFKEQQAASAAAPKAPVEQQLSAKDKIAEALLNRAFAKTEKAPDKDAPLLKPAGTPIKGPSAPFVVERMGLAYGPGHAVSAARDAVPMGDLVRWADPTTGGTVVQFEANAECRLKPVQPGDKLVNVLVSTPYTLAPIRMFDRGPVAAALTAATKTALKSGHLPANLDVDRGQLRQINLVVTDIKAPLHLVLQGGGGILWNIVAAEGVNLSHIALVGGSNSGVGGDIGDASIEVVRARDFGRRPDFFSRSFNAEHHACMAYPATPPNEYWSATEGAASGNDLDANLLYGQTLAARTYGDWYRRNVGVSPQTNLVTAAMASNVLIGPKPSQPLIGRVVTETEIHLPRTDFVMAGNAAEREAATLKIYSDMLSAAAGGPYREVLPKDLKIGSRQGAPSSEVALGRDRVVLGLGVFDGRQDIKDKSDLTGLNDARRAIFERNLPISDLLRPGEARPPEDLLQLYAMLRGPAYMTRYCRDTLSVMATHCGFLSGTAQVLKSGQVRVRSTFGFIQNYDMGPVESRNGGGFISAFLPEEDLTQTFESAEARQALLRRLLAVCDVLRAQYGNCLLGTVSFNLDKPASFAGGAKAYGTGWVEVYTLNQPLEVENFLARAQEVWKQTPG